MALADKIEAVEHAYTGWVVNRPLGGQQSLHYQQKVFDALGDLFGDKDEDGAPVEIHEAVEAYDNKEGS